MLVTGEWITLCAVDYQAGQICRRRPDGAWVREAAGPHEPLVVASDAGYAHDSPETF